MEETDFSMRNEAIETIYFEMTDDETQPERAITNFIYDVARYAHHCKSTFPNAEHRKPFDITSDDFMTFVKNAADNYFEMREDPGFITDFNNRK